MIAVERVYTDDMRLSDRDHAVREVLTTTAGLVGLTARGEQDLRSAVMRHVDLILELADHATTARLELEAIERRMDTHVQEIHPNCTANRDCLGFWVLQIRRNKRWDCWSAAYRALLRGRR